MEQQLAEEAKKRQQQAGKDYGRGKEKGVEKVPQANQGRTRDHVATTVGVNSRYISEAKAIKETAPEVLEEVKQGTLTIPQSLSLCRVQLGSK